MEPYRILTVDDEADLCEILKFNLESEGYRVDTACSAEEAMKLDLAQYDLLLLDIMMERISGLAFAKMLKQVKETASIPLIFLTAKDTENDVVTGFSVGADDYIAKPFSIREVLVRVRAVLKRGAAKAERPEPTTSDTYTYEGLQLDDKHKTVCVDGNEVELTRKEFELLLMFLKEGCRVFSRDEILSHVWSDEVVVLGRTVDVNITRLRKKIGPYGKNIITRTGYGYCFER